MVEAPGIEPRGTSVRSVAKRREEDSDLATQDDGKRREVSASMPISVDEDIDPLESSLHLRAGGCVEGFENARTSSR
jgi:hypothetical protein